MQSSYFLYGNFKILNGKGKCNVEDWQRRSRTSGAYIFEEGNNVQAYLKATGHSDLIKYMLQYKIHIGRKDDVFYFSEYFGDFGYFPNTLRLGHETPFFHPGDKIGNTE